MKRTLLAIAVVVAFGVGGALADFSKRSQSRLKPATTTPQPALTSTSNRPPLALIP